MSGAAAFANLYYKRAVASAKACYICQKPTTTVLATINTVDFIYTCDTHLADPGFATQVGSAGDGVGAGAAKMGLSADEIAKVKAEWEERQKRKAEKAKDKAKDGKEDGEGKEKEKKEDAGEKKSPSPEHRRRRQAAQAKDLAPRLPGAPRTAVLPPT